ncbi:MAG: 2-C-methyl-D-erythritol 2,4-cyclodiphosphate synthase [Opitutae bacterium]|nr:2-C-methyl-D-erythritol 2,4-cyclodiphosphate synthase [Opitutae bacterium]MBG30575.1 2-C-methyl-D-erythritol 2,4-cyclodiphosphate synthase [Opitutae bacterium]|tara:strand:+ start:1636 stop:2130 length:495 start_codon:yes stop_codon:yes gene_type:complete
MKDLPFRIGHGYDIHRFGPKRPLILGGVEIPHNRGLEAHSDGDCLSHAIADAIFGALGLADIGHFFPNEDPSCKGLDSMKILEKALQECNSNGYSLGNIDATIVTESPKIGPHIQSMKAVLSKALDISPSLLGIKATTNEGIGGIGNGDGIAAFAVCLVLGEPT